MMNAKGVDQSFSDAFKWYKAAAVQGHKNAQYYLADMSEFGQGVAQNYNEAVKWCKKSAKQGFVRAQYDLRKLLNEVSHQMFTLKYSGPQMFFTILLTLLVRPNKFSRNAVGQ